VVVLWVVFGEVLWEPWWEKGRDLFFEGAPHPFAKGAKRVGHPADSSRDEAALGMTELGERSQNLPP